MKQISKKVISKTIKQELILAQNFCRQDRGRSYAMMIDTEDGAIWSDVFLSVWDWKEYRSDTIHKLDGEIGYCNDAIHRLHEAGWTIVD